MIRVLQDLSALDGGGVAKLLYDYYRHMDHSKIRFDFMIYNFYDEGIYEKPLREMGCHIYKLPTYTENPDECTKMQEKVISEGNYDVIHTHFGIGGFRILKIAKKYNIPKRIVHSHIAYEPYSLKTKMANVVKRALNKYYATDLLACGIDAGKFMWGNSAVVHEKVFIMKNAIDTNKFAFSSDIRRNKRIELEVEGKLVIGVVGRLSEQKNYPFLFKVYQDILKQREDVELVVIGRGLEEEKIHTLARTMGVYEKIKFLGVRNDVPELLNAFDIFLLPSLYEGLPVVLVEAQANGVYEIVSDKVTHEMNISDLIHYLPIEGETAVQKWSKAICDYIDNTNKRENYADMVTESGYDIKIASHVMEKFYLN